MEPSTRLAEPMMAESCEILLASESSIEDSASFKPREAHARTEFAPPAKKCFSKGGVELSLSVKPVIFFK